MIIIKRFLMLLFVAAIPAILITGAHFEYLLLLPIVGDLLAWAAAAVSLFLVSTALFVLIEDKKAKQP